MCQLAMDELTDDERKAIDQAMALLDPYWRLMRVDLEPITVGKDHEQKI